ncbi:hypothetical protein [Natrarchaeobius chitinivorans]|uniref:Uncharacterized protein n=1 Tax=Natrarchaeobius chitinivorans TaxID=1679083 RepID=A0A3N6MYF3_NATCH|nr:hypothetical protein [Natrarchaeobius chitinivorans]RQG90592.1 hypothetical protein EA473_20805 [Natrarchaeobius chitinivorans]
MSLPPSIHPGRDRFRLRLTLGCVAVLLAALVAFSVVGLAGIPSLSATEFDPETDHEELASGPSIHDADLSSPPRDEVRDALVIAAEDGRYEGTIENASDQYTFLGDERYDFVRFEGAFYEFDADIDGEQVVVETTERDPESIADELAVDLEDAPEPIRETIETGEPVEYPGDTPGRMIVVDDGTYYVVTLGPPHHRSNASMEWVVIPAAALVAAVGALAVGGLWLHRRRGAD